jgi:hypothetical protein
MKFTLVKALAGLTLAGAVALGAAPADARPSPEATRLMRSRAAELYTVKVDQLTAGGGRVHVAAPLDAATRVATDYASYSRIITQFEQSRIVSKQGEQTDVYMRVPILKGAAKIWVVMRFAPPRKVSDDEYLITGKMVRGNVKRFDATYRIRRIDDSNTQLNLEMLIVPRLPFPSSAVAAEVSKACRSAVRQLRNATEAKAKK